MLWLQAPMRVRGLEELFFFDAFFREARRIDTTLHGWARGLGLGFGGTYYTDQSGDLLDTLKIPAYGLVDASVFYRRGHLS